MSDAGIGSDLYTTAMQVVPLLLIALFVDNRGDAGWRGAPRRRRWGRAQDKAYALLAVAAFFTAMFVMSGVINSSRITAAVVIAALGGTMVLLLLLIWRRFGGSAAAAGAAGADPTTLRPVGPRRDAGRDRARGTADPGD